MVTPSSSNYEEGYATHTYTISIADRVLKDKVNEVNVDSDTHQILLDILSQIDNLMYDDVDVVKGGTITPFFDNFRHEVTGHFAEVGIRVKFAYDSCAVPSDIVPLPLPPPFECADASYRVQYVNGTLIEQGTIVSGGSKTINVPNPSTCDPASYEVRDANGSVLYSGTIASGGSQNIVVTNSTVVVRKSDNTIISSVSVLAQGSANYQVSDSVITLTDTAAATISTTNVKATDPATIVAPNGTLNVNKSDGALISGQVVKSGETKGYNVADSVAVIKDSANTTLKSENIKATESENIVVNDSSVENSDASYSVSVLAEGSHVIPDSQINVNSVDSGDVVSVKTIDVNITDGVDPVTPTSVGLVGNTLTIELPSGSTPMDVDFSADKLTALVGENITFTDLSDQSPTHWSWRFDSDGVSILQNPTFSFSTSGFKNITLLSGKVGAGGVDIKNSYIEIVGDVILSAFISAFNTAVGGTMGITQQNALQGFLNRLRGVGTTFSSDLIGNNKISALYPYVPVDDTTANSSGMALDLFLNSNGTFVNFVSGDFTPSGVTGGGTKYLNTNYNPVAQSDSITDFSFGFDAVTSTTATTNPMGVRNVNNSYTASVYAGGNFITGIAETADATRFASANMPANFNLVSVLSTTKKVFNAGVEIDSVTRTGTSFFNGNFFAHAANSNNVAGGHDSRKFRGFVIGKGLTNNESADLYEAWLYLQQNIITGGR
jgi:PKD repeat protein